MNIKNKIFIFAIILIFLFSSMKKKISLNLKNLTKTPDNATMQTCRKLFKSENYDINIYPLGLHCNPRFLFSKVLLS